MNKLILPHHSTDDWEFISYKDFGECDWELSTAFYISAPSCLLIVPYDGGGQFAFVILNHALAQQLLEGRIVFWHRGSHAGTRPPQVQLGTAADYSYQIRAVATLALTDWWRWRVTWWFAYDFQNKPSTRVRIEYWDVDEWKLDKETDYPPLTGAVCRMGIGGYGSLSYYYHLYDDCYIYKGTE